MNSVWKEREILLIRFEGPRANRKVHQAGRSGQKSYKRMFRDRTMFFYKHFLSSPHIDFDVTCVIFQGGGKKHFVSFVSRLKRAFKQTKSMFSAFGPYLFATVLACARIQIPRSLHFCWLLLI